MRVSIITINFNNGENLAKTISSVLEQKFKDYQYIIIDGGSTDISRSVIEKNSRNISYWVSETDNGIFNAMNKGITQAEGDYLVFLNSGDYFLNPDSLQKVIDQNVNEDIVVCDAKWHNNSKKLTDYIQPETVNGQFFYRYSLCHQSILYKKEIFSQFGKYREDLDIVSDWEFNLRALIIHKCSYRHLHIPLVYYDTSGQSSTNLAKMNQERSEVLQSIFSPEELSIFEKNYIADHTIVGKIKKKLNKAFYK